MENLINLTPDTGSIKVTAKGVTLPDTRAAFFMLSNWNAENTNDMPLKTGMADKTVEQTEGEIVFGFNGAYGHQLFPSQTTILLPAGGNLRNVSLRCREGQEVWIWYSWFY